jgi:hypothetical protein
MIHSVLEQRETAYRPVRDLLAPHTAADASNGAASRLRSDPQRRIEARTLDTIIEHARNDFASRRVECERSALRAPLLHLSSNCAP